MSRQPMAADRERIAKVIDLAVERAEHGADAWRRDLILTERGTPTACEANAALILTSHPEWRDVLWLNEFASRAVLRGPPPWTGGAEREGWREREVSDTDATAAAIWMQRKIGMAISPQKVSSAIDAVCQSRRYHPVREHLDGLKWDGVQRIDRWLHTYVGAENNAYHGAVGSRWLIGAVARVYRPGCKLDTALILEGPQGLRKSTAAKVLGGDWFTDTMPDLTSKDAMEQIQGVWIVELAELSALSRAESARIKSFMSASRDRFRPSYGRRAQDFPRQCAFIGTINPEGGYLKDPTGARRFWVVQCGPVLDIEALRRDRDQLWAEAVHRFKAGAPWWLDTPELEKAAAEQQEERYAGDARDDVIVAWVEKNATTDREGRRSVSVAEVLVGAFGLQDSAKWTQADQNVVAKCLAAMGWVRRRRGPRAGREWRYYAPTDPTQGPSGAGGNCVSHSAETGTWTGTRKGKQYQDGVPVSHVSQYSPAHEVAAEHSLNGGGDALPPGCTAFPGSHRDTRTLGHDGMFVEENHGLNLRGVSHSEAGGAASTTDAAVARLTAAWRRCDGVLPFEANALLALHGGGLDPLWRTAAEVRADLAVVSPAMVQAALAKPAPFVAKVNVMYSVGPQDETFCAIVPAPGPAGWLALERVLGMAVGSCRDLPDPVFEAPPLVATKAE